MSTFRNWLSLSLVELHAKGGVWAVCLYLLLVMCSLPVITAFLLAVSIVLIFLVPALALLQGLAWTHAKLFTRNKTHSSNAEM